MCRVGRWASTLLLHCTILPTGCKICNNRLTDLPTGFLQCFDTVGLVIWPVKIVPEMTYNVSNGTLSLYTTYLLTPRRLVCLWLKADDICDAVDCVITSTGTHLSWYWQCLKATAPRTTWPSRHTPGRQSLSQCLTGSAPTLHQEFIGSAVQTGWYMIGISFNASPRRFTICSLVYNNNSNNSRVAPDLIFSNLAGTGFGIADPAGAGAKCSWAGGLGYIT